jgi:hypothetical protein
LAKPVRVPGQSGSKLFDRATAIGAVLAGKAQRQHLALAPLGGRPDHFGDALEHVGVNLPRHERIAELLVLVISLALLLERFPRLLHVLLFSDAPELVRPDQALCHGDDLLCIVLIAEAL